MANSGLGITVGSHSLRAVAVRRKGETYVVTRAVALRAEEGMTAAAGRVLAARGVKGDPVVLGLSGRDVIIRYNQVPPVPDWRLRNLMKFEVMEVSGQSGGQVAADYRKLNLPDPEGERTDETVLVCLARLAYLDPLMQSMTAAGLKVLGGCPTSVGVFNAFAVNATYREDETALLVNVGARGLDLALQRGGELLFARNASPGGKAFTDALVQAFSTTEAKAEALKLGKADVTPRGQAKYADGTAEKVANALMASAGQLSQLVQSTLMIGRAQTRMPDLKVDRVLLTGGGASLKGLDAYLKQAMGVPVERFDPFAACDLSALPDEERAAVEAAPHEYAAALGLAQTGIAPAAFKLAVLPEAVRRRREFATKGVFAVAAGVVAASALVVLYQARTEAGVAVRAQRDVLKAAELKTGNLQASMRNEIDRVQEVAEKHRRLAERAAPGALLVETMTLLLANLKDRPEVWLTETRLQVLDPSRGYVLLHPVAGAGGTYKTSEHNRFERSASVYVVGKIAQGASPDKVFNDFVTGTKASAASRGLVVVVRKTFSAREGQFELEVFPGAVFKPAGDSQVAPWVLRGARLTKTADDKEAVVGQNVEGVPVTVRKDQIDPESWKTFLESSPASVADGSN